MPIKDRKPRKRKMCSFCGINPVRTPDGRNCSEACAKAMIRVGTLLRDLGKKGES